jgi:hypothetical protein
MVEPIDFSKKRKELLEDREHERKDQAVESLQQRFKNALGIDKAKKKISKKALKRAKRKK